MYMAPGRGHRALMGLYSVCSWHKNWLGSTEQYPPMPQSEKYNLHLGIPVQSPPGS